MIELKMKNFLLFLFIIIFIKSNNAGHSSDKTESKKIRLCFVEGRGAYRRASKFCPIIESNSNVQCIVGIDRLDCVRRIHKGSADFGVFSSEDLVAARWYTNEILVTNEMRFHNEPFEYEIVVVIDNEAGIHTTHDLRGARFCHPGLGIETHYNEVLANYFESTLVAKSCDEKLSLNEDRIKSTAKFFGPTCKAGPWVPDSFQDRVLKTRYPSLCQLCYDSHRCGIGDKHWGRRGALYCLTSGGGEVVYARLDDVKSHFGLSGVPQEANPQEYSFLCLDGHLQPINTTHPCVWVAKPWQAVAARISHAAIVQEMVSKLSHDEGEPWEQALLSLLESYHTRINTLDTAIPIDDYLDQATGFQSAHSFPECNPPRSIIYCTTSIIQHTKCSWLQEISQVHGIQPNLQCIRTPNEDVCLDDVQFNNADIVLVDQDSRIKAQRDFELIPLLYEYSKKMHERYVVLAIVKKSSKFRRFSDLKGYTACLPSFEGAAHMSVLATIANKSLERQSIQSFFSSKSCIWDKEAPNCDEKYYGDEGALRCLFEKGDVAFLSSDVYKNFSEGLLISDWVKNVNIKQVELLCPFGSNSKGEYCYMHWTPRGHLMIHNSSQVRHNEVYNSLRDMDRLFGKQYKENTNSFTMFGLFDKRSNIMFRDSTENLKGILDLRKDGTERLLEDVFHDYVDKMYPNFSNIIKISNLMLFTIAITIILGL